MAIDDIYNYRWAWVDNIVHLIITIWSQIPARTIYSYKSERLTCDPFDVLWLSKIFPEENVNVRIERASQAGQYEVSNWVLLLKSVVVYDDDGDRIRHIMNLLSVRINYETNRKSSKTKRENVYLLYWCLFLHLPSPPNQISQISSRARRFHTKNFFPKNFRRKLFLSSYVCGSSTVPCTISKSFLFLYANLSDITGWNIIFLVKCSEQNFLTRPLY